MPDDADDGAYLLRHDLHLVRLSFEACSPLSIGSGESRDEPRKERGSDVETKVSVSEIQRDANGLPTIPGAALQASCAGSRRKRTVRFSRTRCSAVRMSTAMARLAVSCGGGLARRTPAVMR